METRGREEGERNKSRRNWARLGGGSIIIFIDMTGDWSREVKLLALSWFWHLHSTIRVAEHDSHPDLFSIRTLLFIIGTFVPVSPQASVVLSFLSVCLQPTTSWLSPKTSQVSRSQSYSTKAWNLLWIFRLRNNFLPSPLSPLILAALAQLCSATRAKKKSNLTT